MQLQTVALLSTLLSSWSAVSSPIPRGEEQVVDRDGHRHHISTKLFASLEELARITDIAYCVGVTGIQKPFLCASRCQDFPDFELVTQWHTGPLLSDSCGYIALSHPPSAPRIIVAFRGTYSLANTLIDLSTAPQEYIPYPPGGHELGSGHKDPKCSNCTVHSGFLFSWTVTRRIVLPHLERLVKSYPDYRLTLAGHSLGGAVAALAALDFHSRGWDPEITTFGEPRVGNDHLMGYIDAQFNNTSNESKTQNYRRVTHAGDPVPLLPPGVLGYSMHDGEVYIDKMDLPPAVSDIYHCQGDQDPDCITGEQILPAVRNSDIVEHEREEDHSAHLSSGWRWRSLLPGAGLLAHRDYFWRLGLCVPGGDPFLRGPWDQQQQEL